MRIATKVRLLTACLTITMAVAVAGCSGSAGTSAASPSTDTRTTAHSSSPAHSSSAIAQRSRTSSSAAPRARRDPLTGGTRTGHPVIAVKLENTAAAMPQYGLSEADLVFVEEVEGGLTRLMPIYQSSFPTRIEPVRSARSTDIDILPMFGRPLLVYSGVASQVRPKLRRARIRLDDNGSRDPKRIAPHNLYVDLATIARRKGLSSSKDIGLRFAAHDPRLAHAPEAADVTVRIGSDRFSFTFHGSHYLPSWNGRAYTDLGAGGKRVTAKNVLVLKTHAVSDGYRDPAGTLVYKTVSIGSGGLTLYRNGRKLTGRWHRSSPTEPFRLVDFHGEELQLAPGKTWILLQS